METTIQIGSSRINEAAGICAIVVTFNPSLERLAVVLSSLQTQVDRIHVIDNGSENSDRLASMVSLISGVYLLQMDCNLGVGAALNCGAASAIAVGCDFLLLLDQDSVPAITMVADLTRGLRVLLEMGCKLAAIGPRFVNRHSKKISCHVVFSGWHVGRVDCVSTYQPVEVDFLITSGSLIPVKSFREIGLFDENLFIDHVDTEWVLRARAKGYCFFGDCAAVMEHDLGEWRRRIWLWRWREVPIHKPFRYYYIFRNSIWLRGQPYATRVWKRVDAMRLVQLVVFMTLFHPQRFSVLRMVGRGVYDGWRGALGRMQCW